MLKWYKKCVASYCLNILLGDEKVVFRLTHNSWLWTGFLHPFFCSSIFIFHLFYPFIHFSFSSTIIVHPCTHGRIFLHITKYFVPCFNKIFPKKFNPIHLLMFMLTHSSNSNLLRHCCSSLTWRCCSLFARHYCSLLAWHYCSSCCSLLNVAAPLATLKIKILDNKIYTNHYVKIGFENWLV
jgi:hypothetical protein